DITAKPSSCGRNVFFANKFGRFSGVREFYTEISGELNDTRPVTQHVNKYITGTITQLSSSSTNDMLWVRTDADPTVLYQYQFLWSDTEKIQSSWGKIKFEHPVDYTFF